MKRAYWLALLMAPLACAPGYALTLADVTKPNGTSNGAALTIGSLIYSDFSYQTNVLPGGFALPASLVTLSQSAHGLSLSAGWNTLLSGGQLQTTLGYTISALPGTTISSSQLQIVGAAASGGSLIQVSELDTDLKHPGTTFTLQTASDGPGPLVDVLKDTLAITPATTQLSVLRTITLTANPAVPGALASLNLVDSPTFTASTAIPEPAALSLLALGLGALALRAKRPELSC